MGYLHKHVCNPFPHFFWSNFNLMANLTVNLWLFASIIRPFNWRRDIFCSVSPQKPLSSGIIIFGHELPFQQTEYCILESPNSGRHSLSPHDMSLFRKCSSVQLFKGRGEEAYGSSLYLGTAADRHGSNLCIWTGQTDSFNYTWGTMISGRGALQRFCMFIISPGHGEPTNWTGRPDSLLAFILGAVGWLETTTDLENHTTRPGSLIALRASGFGGEDWNNFRTDSTSSVPGNSPMIA